MISTLSSFSFDANYLSDMKIVHADGGAVFLKETKECSNAMLKSFAAEIYEIVQRHTGELEAR